MAHLLLCVKSRPSRRSIPARIPCRRGRPRARLYPPGSPLFGIRAAQLQLLVPGPQDNAPHAGSRNNFPLFASPHASLRLCTSCRAAGPSRPAFSITGGVLSRRQPQGSARRQAPRPGQSSTRRLVAPRSHSFCAQERRRQPRRSFGGAAARRVRRPSTKNRCRSNVHGTQEGGVSLGILHPRKSSSEAAAEDFHSAF